MQRFARQRSEKGAGFGDILGSVEVVRFQPKIFEVGRVGECVANFRTRLRRAAVNCSKEQTELLKMI